jgi:hypothetical protein
MADTVFAVSRRPHRGLTDGAIAVGANFPKMIAADRLRGFESVAVSRAHLKHV